MIITKLERHPDGYYTARVSENGETVDVDNRDGSWLVTVRDAPGRRSFHRRELRRDACAALQARLPIDLRRRAVERPKQKAAA